METVHQAGLSLMHKREPGGREALSGWRREGRRVLDAHLHIVIDQPLERGMRGNDKSNTRAVRGRLGRVYAAGDSFSMGREALLTTSFCTRKRNGINGHVISLLEDDSSLYYKSPIN